MTVNFWHAAPPQSVASAQSCVCMAGHALPVSHPVDIVANCPQHTWSASHIELPRQVMLGSPPIPETPPLPLPVPLLPLLPPFVPAFDVDPASVSFESDESPQPSAMTETNASAAS